MNSDYTIDSIKVCEKTLLFQDQSHTSINIYQKEDRAKTPILLILPALGVRGSYYAPLAHIIVSAGFGAATMDWRGSGKSSVTVSRKTRFGYHEIIATELPEVVNCIRDTFPGRPLYLLGHSLGGQIGLLFAALDRHTISGVIMVAAGSNYYKNLKAPRRFGRYFNLLLIRWITSLFGFFPGDKLGFAGKESKTMIRDWLQEAMSGRYSVRNSVHDFERLLRQIDIPVLFITLFKDTFVTEKCAQFLAAKLKTADVSQIELDAADYNLPDFSHFNWVKNPSPIFDHVQKWMA